MTHFRDEDKKSISAKVIEEVDKWMERFDCLVIGPGLGRDPFLLVSFGYSQSRDSLYISIFLTNISICGREHDKILADKTIKTLLSAERRLVHFLFLDENVKRVDNYQLYLLSEVFEMCRIIRISSRFSFWASFEEKVLHKTVITIDYSLL